MRISFKHAMPLFLGIVGTLAMSYGLTTPSFWQDEAATMAGAERPLPVLLKMAQHIDVVHASYYAFMHLWAGLFGYSVIAMRLPSALAVGATCSLLYLLVRKLNGSYAIAIGTSLLYLAIPRTHFASGESRSNALTATLAVALTLCLISAAENRRMRLLPWIGYAAIATLSTYDFMFSALLAVPHLAFVIFRYRSQIWHLLGAWLLAFLIAMPLFYWGYEEKNQVSWIKLKPLNSYLFEAFFSVNFLTNYLLAGLFLTLGALVIFTYFRHRDYRSSSTESRIVELSLLWVALPSTVLIILSFALRPYFVEHYLTFTTPATAMIGAIGLSKLTSKTLTALAVILVIGLGFLSLQESRAPWAHGPVWFPLIRDLAANTAPGDGLLLPDWRTRNSAEIQIMLDAYRVDYLRGRVDLTLTEPPNSSSELFGVHSKEQDAPMPRSLMKRIALVSDIVDPVSAFNQAPSWMRKNYRIALTKHYPDANVTYFSLKR